MRIISEVDEKKQEFTFKNARFNFTLVLGSTNDGLSVDYDRKADGKGSYEYIDDDNIKLEDVEIVVDLDLMGEEEDRD